ncbi:MAG: hypothetical protein MI923_09780, partial [Phycisphaerales bacterium]|nr:hypothetical protein [Phycisphaerales bacterium]
WGPCKARGVPTSRWHALRLIEQHPGQASLVCFGLPEAQDMPSPACPAFDMSATGRTSTVGPGTSRRRACLHGHVPRFINPRSSCSPCSGKTVVRHSLRLWAKSSTKSRASDNDMP